MLWGAFVFVETSSSSPSRPEPRLSGRPLFDKLPAAMQDLPAKTREEAGSQKYPEDVFSLIEIILCGVVTLTNLKMLKNLAFSI